MQSGEFKKLTTTNRQLIAMIVFGVIALGSYSFYAIASEIQEQEEDKLEQIEDKQEQSKLDAILALAKAEQVNNSLTNKT